MKLSSVLTAALSAFSVADQQSGIHCLIIQLLTLNNLDVTWRRIWSPDIRSVSALEVLRNRALQIDIDLLTHSNERRQTCSTHFTHFTTIYRYAFLVLLGVFLLSLLCPRCVIVTKRNKYLSIFYTLRKII